MGNCGSTYSLDQCAELVKKPLQADSNIFGAGVLAGFAATAILTFGAIILGYFTGSLQDRYLNDVDHKVIEGVSSSWMGILLVRTWKGFVRISRRILFLSPPGQEDKLTADQRRRSFDKFVLTLSDQQLVTGIAILVACFGNWCRTSLYELYMTVSLAWFSSATHLATLDVLKHYFQDNRVVRNWRMIGMVAIVLLLIGGLITTGLFFTTNTMSIPIPCVISLKIATILDCNGTMRAVDEHGRYDSGRWKNNPNFSNCSKYYETDTTLDARFELVGPLLTVAYLLYGYATSLLRTFSLSGEASFTLSHLILLFFVNISVHRSKGVSLEDVNNAIIENSTKAKARSEQRFKKPFGSKYEEKFRWLHIIFVDYLESFLCRIGSFSFALSYGGARVVNARLFTVKYRKFGPGMKFRDGGIHVDFGQIVPLVLLILPVLAAVEIFHENENKEASQVLKRDTALPPTAGAASNPGDDQEVLNTTTGADERSVDVLTKPAYHASSADSANNPPRQEEAFESGNTTIQSSDQYSFLLLGSIFAFHVVLSATVGVLLTQDTPALSYAPFVAFSFLFVFLVSYLVRMRSTFRIILSTAASKPFKSHSSQHSKDATELSTVNTGAGPQDSVSSTVDGLRSEDTAKEGLRCSVLSTNSQQIIDNDGGTSQAATDRVADVNGTQHSADAEIENEDEIYVAPKRQDTESGLRQR